MKLEERFLHGAGEIRRLAMQTLLERPVYVWKDLVLWLQGVAYGK